MCVTYKRKDVQYIIIALKWALDEYKEKKAKKAKKAKNASLQQQNTVDSMWRRPSASGGGGKTRTRRQTSSLRRAL